MIVLAATGTDPAQLEYAMEWVHYLVDPPTTEWGRLRAANGHPEPYRVPYIQIDNEPMNHGFRPTRTPPSSISTARGCERSHRSPGSSRADRSARTT